ncbi:MAG TPA: hypothetical protein VJJ51_00495 [Candidatus Methanoperedens sp.]|nr:hypothetical protein [Candidatus Methanoperedens sp.]HLB69500.1 hypothetical protein [Candidatus Methanoperedens sp.]
MERRKVLSVVILLLAILLIIDTASAATPGGATVGAGGTSTGSASTPQTNTSQGGYITELNITDATQITSRWQGYYGNVTGGSIVLKDSSNTFYSWSANLANSGYVYATTNTGTPAWSSVAAVTTITDLDTASYWNFLSKSDNISNTYNTTGSITVAGTTVSNTAKAPTLHSNFNDYVIQDNSASDMSEIIWVAAINNDKQNFKSGLSDYELLVPVHATTRTYYFYLEII